MADVDRYVVVPEDRRRKTIEAGPYLWDGEAEWQPPAAGRLLREADALEAGYHYPAAEQG